MGMGTSGPGAASELTEPVPAPGRGDLAAWIGTYGQTRCFSNRAARKPGRIERTRRARTTAGNQNRGLPMTQDLAEILRSSPPAPARCPGAGQAGPVGRGWTRAGAGAYTLAGTAYGRR